MNYCVKCGQKIVKGTNYCTKCGAPIESKSYTWGGSVDFQEDEAPFKWMNDCNEYFEDRELGMKLGRKGFLILTNQRLLFASKTEFHPNDYGVTYVTDLKDIVSVSPGKAGRNDKITVTDNNDQANAFTKYYIHALVPLINNAILHRKEHLELKTKKENAEGS